MRITLNNLREEWTPGWNGPLLGKNKGQKINSICCNLLMPLSFKVAICNMHMSLTQRIVNEIVYVEQSGQYLLQMQHLVM